ncbi:hypothetical protein BDV12DRAFT_164138 [Aspergillus spectabilis]
MYNPWGAHNHGHHPHPHTHHGHTTHHTPTPTITPVSVPGTVSAGTRMDLDSSPSHTQSPSQSSYQMSQMRWLPSMITRSHNPNTAALPTISSNLRMHSHQQQQHQQNQQGQGQQASGVPVVVEGRAPALVNPVSVSQAQSQAQAQAVAISVESEESDRSESPGTRDVSGADALGEPEFGAGDAARNGLQRGEGGIMDVEILAENGKASGGNGELAQPGVMNLTPRKHGKRLTTKEEVSLFEICNRHAEEFGQRSNLCKWWMTVTMEFTRGQKHPYSWHSVRRKVELVTKQRMRFLEEQREKGASEADDLSNPRWRAVVDTWIPTWQRWEEAEARRIEKRDSRRPRKRKWTITTPTSTTITTDGGWDIPHSTPADAWRMRVASSSSNSPMGNNPQTTSHHPPPSSTPLSSTPVRLPPGFDTLFTQSQPQSQPQPHTQTPTSTSSPLNTHHHTHHHHIPSTPTTTTPSAPTHPVQTSTPNPNPADNTMMAAVLETLGKLNKRLESTSAPSLLPNTSTPTPSSSQNPLSIPEALLSSSQPPTSTQNTTSTTGTAPTLNSSIREGGEILPATALSKLKETLKQEMLHDLRTEWDKERAVLEEKLDSVQRTQEMILEMLRQEPS